MRLPAGFAFAVICALALAACERRTACETAAEHAAACTGQPVAAPATCTREDSIAAEAMLEIPCDAFSDPGKADSFSESLRCSWVGKQLGQCTRIPPDAEVLTTLNAAPTAALADGTLRVLVWNVFKGHRDEWDGDMATLAADVDLSLVQEFYLDDDSTHTFEGLGDKAWWFATSFANYNDDSGTPTGVATGARVEPLSSQFLRSAAIEPVSWTPKMAIATTYALPGRDETLLVVNIHAINFRGVSPFMDQIDQIADVIAAHEGPALVAGDFNTWWPERTSYMIGTLGGLGLAHVEFEDDDGTLILDHAFVRGLDVQQAAIFDGIESSDHAPRYLELTVP